MVNAYCNIVNLNQILDETIKCKARRHTDASETKQLIGIEPWAGTCRFIVWNLTEYIFGSKFCKFGTVLFCYVWNFNILEKQKHITQVATLAHCPVFLTPSPLLMHFNNCCLRKCVTVINFCMQLWRNNKVLPTHTHAHNLIRSLHLFKLFQIIDLSHSSHPNGIKLCGSWPENIMKSYVINNSSNIPDSNKSVGLRWAINSRFF